ncbi:unnamed protein product [Auanema sp. JU1783]|nr:unnamed protein product [Auanema sp. JU1783]
MDTRCCSRKGGRMRNLLDINLLSNFCCWYQSYMGYIDIYMLKSIRYIIEHTSLYSSEASVLLLRQLDTNFLL